ncbi:hypothetical protein SISNIDRAFT_358111 [Sistotremastrum niveocremeum HHB9708]|uniref:Uncharacterized protein n=1 Tax=Sistotremastrum niveocremeum HHB9708 TaxID=1314777 RepID=A0A164WL38_9AGAM|nr:hypothetical protein SISNIDRAFT_358111 [Sistotremastrum niveocremeum HHB9708]
MFPRNRYIDSDTVINSVHFFFDFWFPTFVASWWVYTLGCIAESVLDRAGNPFEVFSGCENRESKAIFTARTAEFDRNDALSAWQFSDTGKQSISDSLVSMPAQRCHGLAVARPLISQKRGLFLLPESICSSLFKLITESYSIPLTVWHGR